MDPDVTLDPCPDPDVALDPRMDSVGAMASPPPRVHRDGRRELNVHKELAPTFPVACSSRPGTMAASTSAARSLTLPVRAGKTRPRASTSRTDTEMR